MTKKKINKKEAAAVQTKMFSLSWWEAGDAATKAFIHFVALLGNTTHITPHGFDFSAFLYTGQAEKREN